MMLFTRVYISVCMYLKISGEITKNIYTLHLVQKQIRERERILAILRQELFNKLKGIKTKLDKSKTIKARATKMDDEDQDLGDKIAAILEKHAKKKAEEKAS